MVKIEYESKRFMKILFIIIDGGCIKNINLN